MGRRRTGHRLGLRSLVRDPFGGRLHVADAIRVPEDREGDLPDDRLAVGGDAAAAQGALPRGQGGEALNLGGLSRSSIRPTSRLFGFLDAEFKNVEVFLTVASATPRMVPMSALLVDYKSDASALRGETPSALELRRLGGKVCCGGSGGGRGKPATARCGRAPRRGGHYETWGWADAHIKKYHPPQIHARSHVVAVAARGQKESTKAWAGGRIALTLASTPKPSKSGIIRSHRMRSGAQFRGPRDAFESAQDADGLDLSRARMV